MSSVAKACHEAGEEIRDFLGDQPVKIIASGISCFNGQRLAPNQRTNRSYPKLLEWNGRIELRELEK